MTRSGDDAMAGPEAPVKRPPWWRSIGPALITACVVFGPGSLLISSNVGAKHGYSFLWLLALTGVLMGTYLTIAARIGVVGGATPCTLVAQRAGRGFAAVVGITLCLICSTFQFSNNLAFRIAVETLVPGVPSVWFLVGLNGVIIAFFLTARNIYRVLERAMKVMVGVILACFLLNLVVAGPRLLDLLFGFVPQWPSDVPLGLPQKVDGKVVGPLLLIAALMGTTFSVAGAFFQGNLVREKGWKIEDYTRGVNDSIAGVAVLAGVSAAIMITTATVIPGRPATDIGVLAQSLQPILGTAAHTIFCVGLLAVAMNPFLINAMIGGTILADGIGKPARLSDAWPRRFTIAVLLLGMAVAIMVGEKKNAIQLIIFGQALTVLGNPLMAAVLLWLANRKDIMGERKNSVIVNILGAVGLAVVLFLAVWMLYRVILTLS
jgi:Mn2+/Fe2+ NRAMP family transporter